MEPIDKLDKLPFGAVEAFRLAPVVTPALFGLAALMADLGLRGKSKTPLAIIAVAGAVLSGFLALSLWRGDADQAIVAGSVAVSGLGAALAVGVLLGTTIMALAGAHNDLAPDGTTRSSTLSHGEMYGLMLFATSGMLALGIANDFVTLFVALETLSIAVYAMTGIDRRRPRAAEGAMKYFVLGAFSSGFLLYGMSLVYGATGTMHLTSLARLDLTGPSTLASTGGVLILIGLLFKVAAVPFHAWSPDAYEGAPSQVTGFMSVGVKVAAFGAALRVCAALGQAGALSGGAAWTLWLVAALTIVVGNAGALSQRNPRRLLAYSSIAHSGYVLIGLVAVLRAFDREHPIAGPAMFEVGKDAAAGVLFYVIGYGAANATAFAVLSHLERDGKEIEDVGELAGLARAQP
jgi:NADH-quinone oxidoreductase subunit N